MSDRIISRLYIAIIVLLFFVLLLLIIIPYGFAPEFIPIIWGKGVTLFRAVWSSVLNLIFGIMASSLLAYLISQITIYHQMDKECKEYHKSIKEIVSVCRFVTSGQDVGQFMLLIDMYDTRKINQIVLNVDKQLLFLPSRKKEFRVSVYKINDIINDLKSVCDKLKDNEKHHQETVNICIADCGKVLALNRYSKEYKELRTQMLDNIREAEIVSASRIDILNSLSVPINQLDNECNELEKILYSNV